MTSIACRQGFRPRILLFPLDNESEGPHLIVVPASVLSNWKREFQKFCPVLRVEVYHGNSSSPSTSSETIQMILPRCVSGSQKDRYEIQDRLTTDEDFDILLTTYSYFERENCKDDRSSSVTADVKAE